MRRLPVAILHVAYTDTRSSDELPHAPSNLHSQARRLGRVRTPERTQSACSEQRNA